MENVTILGVRVAADDVVDDIDGNIGTFSPLAGEVMG